MVHVKGRVRCSTVAYRHPSLNALAPVPPWLAAAIGAFEFVGLINTASKYGEVTWQVPPHHTTEL